MSTPYELIEREDGYSFLTEDGLSYLVYFRPKEPDFPLINLDFPGCHSLGFSPVGVKVTNSFDKRIEATILGIVHRYFETDPSRIIFWICDTSDGKQMIRHRLFDRWYKRSLLSEFEKFDVVYRKDENAYPFTFVIPNNHPELERIKSELSLLLFQLDRGAI